MYVRNTSFNIRLEPIVCGKFSRILRRQPSEQIYSITMAIFLSGLKVLLKVTLVLSVLAAVIIIVPGIPPNIPFESYR